MFGVVFSGGQQWGSLIAQLAYLPNFALKSWDEKAYI